MAVEEYLPYRAKEFAWPEYASEQEVDYHCIILIDAGLLKGTYSRTFGGKYHVLVERLTPYGHEYIDALRDDSVFTEVQKQLSARNLASIPLDVLLRLAQKVINQMVGLD